MKKMIQEGMDYCEMTKLTENGIRDLAVRVLTRIEEAWDKYLDDIAEGRKDPRVKIPGKLTSHLNKHPINN